MELSRLHWLFVIARGSTFRFRDAGVDIAEAGRILGARYVLTGTIAFHDRTSVVTVELSHAPDGQVVWADRFESSMDDLLQLRSTISANIVTAIETRIQVKEAIEAAKLPTENLDAWSAYHRGLWHMYRFNPHDNAIAARMFDRAVTADQGFARAHAGLSFTHFQNAFLGHAGDHGEQRSLARLYAEKGLQLDPFDPFVNLMMGRSQWLSGDLDAGVPWLERSVELSPNYAFAIYNRALLGALMGDGQTSQDNITKAISLSPSIRSTTPCWQPAPCHISCAVIMKRRSSGRSGPPRRPMLTSISIPLRPWRISLRAGPSLPGAMPTESAGRTRRIVRPISSRLSSLPGTKPAHLQRLHWPA